VHTACRFAVVRSGNRVREGQEGVEDAPDERGWQAEELGGVEEGFGCGEAARGHAAVRSCREWEALGGHGVQVGGEVVQLGLQLCDELLEVLQVLPLLRLQPLLVPRHGSDGRSQLHHTVSHDIVGLTNELPACSRRMSRRMASRSSVRRVRKPSSCGTAGGQNADRRGSSSSRRQMAGSDAAARGSPCSASSGRNSCSSSWFLQIGVNASVHY
jgi:hypothetical protein